jgi:predicted tellurium resistance membrane protein TerC
MHERIGLPVVALNEAEALHRVEELDRTGRLLAGQLPLRRTAGATAIATRAASGALGSRPAIFHCHRLAVDLEIGRRNASATIDQREAERLAFGQTGQAGLFDRTDVNEHVLAAIIANDEAEALLAIEEFDDARAFANDLGGHAATSAAATTTEAATTAAAAAIATATTATAAEAATTAEAIAATAEAITTTAETIAAAEAAAATEVVAAETVALVAATSATIAAATFIETHALFVFPPRSVVKTRATPNEKRRSPGAEPITPPTRSRLKSRAPRTNSSKLRQSWPRYLHDRCHRATGRPMSFLSLVTDPAAWAALATLIVMEIVLGIDNLIFISILSNKLPPEQRERVRRLGIGLALILRLALLSTIAWIAGMTAPVIDLGVTHVGADGHTSFETALSIRDLILIAGGVFLLYKATTEIHHSLDPVEKDEQAKGGALLGFGSAIIQILALDMVFSIDSILTAIGMTDDLPVMIVAVITAVAVMLFAATPLAEFIARNPSVVMLALGFLLMIGVVLIADGFGVHVPKGYVYSAMAFAGAVEVLNLTARRKSSRTAGH